MSSDLIFFFQYLKKPFHISFNRKMNFYELLLLGGAYVLCVFFIGGIIKIYCIITHIQPTAGHLDIANDTFLSSLLIVVLAPIKEEIQFRLLLRPKKPNLLLFNVVMLSTSLIFVYFEKWQQAIVYLIITALFSVFFVFFKKQIKLLYSKYFTFIFYFSASLFALLHVNNYDGNSLYIKLGILILVAPQFISGVIMAYFRVNYGLKYAILFHMVNNFIALIFVLKQIVRA